jgi:predicted ATPase
MSEDRAVRHLERVEWIPNRWRPPELQAWPYAIPAVAQLIAEGGLDIDPGVTFVVGENGSGKSTLVEAFAAVYPRAGVATPFADVLGPAPSAEDSPLSYHLRARTNRMASHAGFFLRAEAMHGYFASIDDDPRQARAWGGERLQRQSHGESFLAVLRHRFADVGVYFLDEPEAALSFRSCLGLIALFDAMRREGSQLIVATHSPLLVSLPEATLLEVGEWGIRRAAGFEDLEVVGEWRSFLDAPPRFLKHLLDN